MQSRSWSHVALTYGRTGQTVEMYPPVAELINDGPPASAANYRVLAGTKSNDETAEIALTAATLDSVSTTVDVVSGYAQTNRTRLYLTATTNIAIGRYYLVANTAGQREVVRVANIAAGDYVELEVPLSYDYAITSSTFKGIRHYFTIDATFIATESKINVYGTPSLDGGRSASTNAPPYRVEWVYSTAGSIPRNTWTTFDVVRQQFKHSVSVGDIRRLVPDVVFTEWTQQRGQGFEPQIDEAAQRVQYDIRMAGYDPDAVRDPFVLDQLIKYATLSVLKGAGLPLELTFEDYEGIYRKKFDAAIGTSLKAWMDTGSEGSITPAPAQQLWLRR